MVNNASPIFSPDGSVGGLVAVVAETTERVIRERRLRTLGELGTGGLAARTPEHAYEIAAGVLEKDRGDIPFATSSTARCGGRGSRPWSGSPPGRRARRRAST